VSSRIRFISSAVLAILVAPIALACSAGGGSDPSTIPGAPGDSMNTGNPSAGNNPTLVPTLPVNDPGSTDLGASSEEDPECDNILDVTYRDFTEAHPDFEMAFRGDVVRLTLVQPNLGADGKPEFRSSIGCQWDQNARTKCSNGTPTQPVINSKATFDQWFRTTAGTNMEIKSTLALDEPSPDHYVFDSSSFFPLAPTQGLGPSPKNGDNPENKNYLFTTEIHVSFTYAAGQQFTFRGDDDLWIFVNKKLALDLGSMHGPEQGTIDFDAQASFLGIVPGRSYEMDIFQAERHTSGSNFRFETNISCFVPQIVR
jgi:fibro-slime domain-containing protein